MREGNDKPQLQRTAAGLSALHLTPPPPLQLPPERQGELQSASWSMGSRADFQLLEAADPEAEAPGGLTLRSLGLCAFLFWASWKSQKPEPFMLSSVTKILKDNK